MTIAVVAVAAGSTFGCPTAPTADDDTGDDDTTAADDCDVDPLELGLYHRVEAVDCSPDERTPSATAPALCGSQQGDTCASHADCADGANGRCFASEESGLCSCRYDECLSDGDCPGTGVCACATQGPFERFELHACLHSSCRVDADCDVPYCMAIPTHMGTASPDEDVSIAGFACATSDDSCRNDEVCWCDDPDDRCLAPDAGGPWSCSSAYASMPP